MGNSVLCVCGHNKTDHEHKRISEGYETIKEWRGECDWIDCHCKLFEDEGQ